MESPGTVLIVSKAGTPWSAAREIFIEEYGYRVLKARTRAEPAATLQNAHVDLVIAEAAPPISGRLHAALWNAAR